MFDKVQESLKRSKDERQKKRLEKEYGNERPNHPDGVAENAAAPEQ